MKDNSNNGKIMFYDDHDGIQAFIYDAGPMTKKEIIEKKQLNAIDCFFEEAGLKGGEDWEFIIGEPDKGIKGGRNLFKSGALKLGKLLIKKGYDKE